jgi:hypothetical protein
MASDILILVTISIIAAIAAARLFPDGTRQVAEWFFKARRVFGALFGLALVYFFLTSGITILVVFGALGIVFVVWWALFNDVPLPNIEV